MDQRHYQILTALSNTKNMHGDELARIIKMSSRSVRTIIKELNVLLLCHGASIQSNKATGYELCLQSPMKFLQFMQQEAKNIQDYNDPLQRVEYLFFAFLNEKEYLKIDDLCEQLFISRSQLKQSLKELREYYATYGLTLIQKPHNGLKLEGDEVKKRLCIAHFQMEMNKRNAMECYNDKQDKEEIATIKNIVYSCIQNADYHIADDTANNLIMHLFIALSRMRKQQYVPLEQTMIQSLKQEREFEIAQNIMTVMTQIFNIKYDDNECGYITIHLCGKQTNQQNAMIISEEVVELVNKIFSVIRRECDIDFRKDFHLQLALSQHIVPLLKRIEYKVFMNNPLLKDIKGKLIRSYEIALYAAEVIQTTYECTLPEDEIGYFALHFNVALERSEKEIIKKNILIVCSSGAGSAQLLRYRFQDLFSKYIQRLDVCSAHEIIMKTLKGYDYIFSTIPLQIQTDVPIIYIHHLIDQSDLKTIHHRLKGIPQQKPTNEYFKKALFMGNVEFASKEQAIQEMVAYCRKQYPLPEDFELELLKREEMASTEFSELMAFPHSNRLVSDETFVCVAVLRKPLLWTSNKIRIIMLASIEKGSIKQLDNFYKAISSIIASEDYQWRLIANPSYDELLAILKEVDLL